MWRNEKERRDERARSHGDGSGTHAKPGAGHRNSKKEGEIRHLLVADQRAEKQPRDESDCNKSERKCVAFDGRSYAPDSYRTLKRRDLEKVTAVALTSSGEALAQHFQRRVVSEVEVERSNADIAVVHRFEIGRMAGRLHHRP